MPKAERNEEKQTIQTNKITAYFDKKVMNLNVDNGNLQRDAVVVDAVIDGVVNDGTVLDAAVNDSRSVNAAVERSQSLSVDVEQKPSQITANLHTFNHRQAADGQSELLPRQEFGCTETQPRSVVGNIPADSNGDTAARTILGGVEDETLRVNAGAKPKSRRGQWTICRTDAKVLYRLSIEDLSGIGIHSQKMVIPKNPRPEDKGKKVLMTLYLECDVERAAWKKHGGYEEFLAYLFERLKSWMRARKRGTRNSPFKMPHSYRQALKEYVNAAVAEAAHRQQMAQAPSTSQSQPMGTV